MIRKLLVISAALCVLLTLLVLAVVPAAAVVSPSVTNPRISSSYTVIPVDETQNGTTIVVNAGDEVVVRLSANHTTGFFWGVKQISDTGILELVGSTFIPDTPIPGATGQGGTDVWTFRAIRHGAAILSMEYSQPWNGGIKGYRTFNLTVQVSPVGTPASSNLTIGLTIAGIAAIMVFVLGWKRRLFTFARS
jgi:inhibitor of cysteine peptidase